MITGEMVPPAVRRQIPAVVVVSTVLLWLSGFARLALATTGLVEDQAYLAAVDTVEGLGGFAAVPVLGVLVKAAILVLVASALVALALINLRGLRWSRIATWTLGGLALLVTTAGVGFGLLASLDDAEGGPTLDWAQIYRLADAEIPAWVGPVSTVAEILAPLGLVAGLVLLAVPAANAFFRRPGPTYA
ncbi:hypothetical protein [Asanoa siamensis]|uniref:Membrane protein (TIGR02234 family) n=1 Tax=Asanoa siamensis TaxID=926357 RepID=A0ABQ4CZ23_9ACTN|nr:hypothetical protein [Asanoa siamensis]GIF76518.1 hypothetical protein Asi02nite_60360 [Asanoa siamensis]